jgi:hypothetical protein
MATAADLRTAVGFDMTMEASLQAYYKQWNECNALLDTAIQAGDTDAIQELRQTIKAIKVRIRARGGQDPP